MNTAIFAKLDDTELYNLSTSVYHGVTRLFDAATAIFGQMSQTQTWVPEYDQMQRRAAVLMAAGREQNQLFSEITDETRARRAEAELRIRIAENLAQACSFTEMDAAAAIETADQADDPMKTERRG
jgi:hypothetical protein